MTWLDIIKRAWELFRALLAKLRHAEVKARYEADEVQNDVGAMPPDARRKELRKWSR